MKDAQNLAKLLGHLPPKVFRAFMIEELNATLPELQEKDGKRKQRAEMAQDINALPISSRQNMEEIAEKIAFLCDVPGQDALDWRKADYLHQSQIYYDGFVATKDLTVLDDKTSIDDFHENLAAHFNCNLKDIAVRVFRRQLPGWSRNDCAGCGRP